MIERSFAASDEGGIVCYDAGRVRKVHLDVAFMSIGLQSLLPRREKRATSLRRALTDYLAGQQTSGKTRGRRYDLNRLDSKVLGFEAVLQSKGDEKNLHEYQMTAKLTPNDRVVASHDGVPLGQDTSDLLTSLYREHMDFYCATTVGSLIIAAITKWSGTAIRGRGGVYFLPGYRLGGYLSLAQDIESSPDSQCVMHLVRFPLRSDDYTTRTVLTGFRQDTRAFIDEMNADLLSDGSMTEPGFNSRVNALTAAKQRVVEYQDLFQEQLRDLTDALDATETALQVARLSQISN
jgi:hypothetical protein